MQAKHEGAVGGGGGRVGPPEPQDGRRPSPPAEGHDLRLDPEPFRVEIRPGRDRVHITPIGELDLASAGAVADQLDELLDAGFDHLVIDLHRLSFIDSAGVRALAAAGERARHTRATLDVVGARGQVKRVLTLTGVDHQLGLIAGNRHADARRSHDRGAGPRRASAAPIGRTLPPATGAGHTLGVR